MAEPSPKEFQPYRNLQAKTETELRAILELTAKRIEARVALLNPGIGGQVRAAQLRTALAAINRLLRSMWVGQVNPLVARAIEDSLKASEDAIETMTRVAYAGLPEAAAETLVGSLRATAQSGLKSDAARRKRQLSARVYRQRALDDGKVEEMIRAGIISGLSAKELAADVRKYVSPRTKGGASYAAMRLARTEINNAFHERQIEGAKRPGVSRVKWNLSGSHKVPDECNVYASHGGQGEWPPEEIPDKPHPQCFCYLTYITFEPQEFKAKLEAGDFDDEINRRTRENMARLGQKVGPVTPLSVVPDKVQNKKPLTGQAVHDSVPKGLFKRGSMTPQQRKELKTYETGWFIVVNNFLREKRQNDPDYKREQLTVDRMKEALDGSVLPNPIQTWRGMYNSRLVFGESFDSDLTDFTWDDLGFGSTTTNEEITDNFRAPESLDNRIRKAYKELLKGKSSQEVSLVSLRDKLDDVPHGQLTRKLLELDRQRKIILDADPNRNALTDRAKAAAISLGGEEMHLITIEEKNLGLNITDNVKMKVIVPAGVKALETSSSTKGSSENGPQAEITLQEGLTWRVVKDHGYNPEGIRELEVEVYPIGSRDD